MSRGLAGLVLFAALAMVPAAPAAACPPPSETLLFHSCWGRGKLEILLLPEDLPLPEAGSGDTAQRLIVTGAYTARDERDGGLPKPVGMFVRGGTVANPNLGRMDGVLLVDPATGRPEVRHRARLPLGGRDYDLRELGQRRAFLAEAAARGLSVMQSHLLIVDGELDIEPHEEAPVFVRRMLFEDGAGFGLYQTRQPRALYDAARQLADALAPRMALNLDMGSYNYCRRLADGVDTVCGALQRGSTGKLSNLLMLTLE